MNTSFTRFTRREVFQLAGTSLLCSSALMRLARAQSVAGAAANLLTAPIEVGGQWGASPPWAAQRVIVRMRNVCLSDVMLVSDRQPDKIRVDNHTLGSPAIWLHDDRTRTAWAIVDVGGLDWCKLAYQFGHELGHILSNSWEWNSKGTPPCQWLEESMVEAFSIRGLGLLADSWEGNPPFTGDNKFAAAIRDYRRHVIDNYAKAAGRADIAVADWFRISRKSLEATPNLSPTEGPAIVAIAAELAADDRLVADLGALNRWPQRTHVPLEDYLALWTRSCAQLGTRGRLPARIKTLLRL